MRKFSIFGVNQANLINTLLSNGISIVKLNKIHNTQLDIVIKSIDAKKFLFILNKKNYKYQSTFPPYQWIFCLLGIAVVGGFLYICNLFCWGVEFAGSTDITLKEKLKSEYVGKLWSNIDCDVIKNNILSSSEVGLVSVSRRGGILVIDYVPYIAQKDNIVANFSGIISNFSGIVSNIFVISGTPMVKVGDSVSIGQLLIAPYWMNGENKIVCEARGDISLYVWQSATVEFTEDSLISERTGNFKKSFHVLWGNQILASSEVDGDYSQYEKEEKVEYLSSILPIKFITTYIYEVIEIPYHSDFLSEKDALIMLARQKLLTNVLESDILEEKSAINEFDGKFYVSYYAKLEIDNG